MGSLIDTILTDPDSFSSRYFVLEKDIKLSGKLEGFVQKYHEYQLYGLDKKTAFEQAYKESGYKISRDVIQKSLDKPDVKVYLDILRRSAGKKIIPKDLFNTAEKVCKSLRENEHTKKYFGKKTPEGVERLYQYGVIFPIVTKDDPLFKTGVIEHTCKGLLDLVYVDHNTQSIYPIDLKTTSKLFDFESSFLRFRYYLQAAFYHEAIVQAVAEGLLPNYKIQNFQFVVQDSEGWNPPLIFEVSPKTLSAGRYGGTFNDTYYKGYEELLKELHWHNTSGYWDMPKQYADSNFKILLDVFS